ncbi:penicillin-binding protein 2 [Methylotenera sp.]|uniref:peptidoglycan D,D-transpeptidase FtsI family protein n=1 Tax=Methylotenera sp. TaxID=2051956 RepID=UPI00272F206D|nr:penicillin-binding protein 2 [Methylotenera sp.]MDP1521815.1 penicillin-binding protein 2 [Methylotenera sp.]MDP2070725.1 penicillin-binding protein 2 [Methylotenera sp.]MDP3004794.1 penicillin-binding protein 2 [Methylotenera sp.]MDP3818446.1 penicillin-binding protein 2 [Methylotenera sp.]
MAFRTFTRSPVNTPVVVKLPAWRRRVLLVSVLLGFAALLGRGIYLQGIHKKFLQDKGDARYSRNLVLTSQRGKITDRNGELLATSTPVESVWASPPDVKIDAAQTKQIAGLLNLKVDDVKKKLANSEREFVYLKRRISPELAAKVMKLGIPGIDLQREYKRYYPAGDVTAHMVGFTGPGDKGAGDRGLEGFELQKNSSLSGVDGSRRVIKDRSGRIIEDLQAVKVPQDGRDVTLSIDLRIQYLAHRELVKAVEANKAAAGAVVVLDAKSGEVLAIANVPTYNPNNPVNIKGKTRNRAIVDTFEPGSTLKSVTVAAALESGKYTPETKIQTAPGSFSIGPATVRDSHPHGILTVAEVLQKSSNVGTSKITLTLDKQYMWSIYNELGLGHVEGIGFPGEASGRLRPYKTWRPIEQATMSFGHGISLTLLQLARLYTVFANEGELRPISLLKLTEMPIGQQVFSAATANHVKDMLELVVQPGGTAVRAQVLGYRVGGKTGTAHKLGERGYVADKYVASFVGMAPASDPRFIIAVIIDEPSGGAYFGGTVAAPVFSTIMSDTLRLYAVPQDAPNNNVVLESNDEDVKEGI